VRYDRRMKRICLALLLVGCGDDDGAAESTSGTTVMDASTGDAATDDPSSSSSSGSSSSSSGDGETVAPTTGSMLDVVSCVALPNEIAVLECDVILCVGDAVCEFTNACECAQGEPQIELGTGDPLEVRVVGEWTIDCGEQESTANGCTNLPADTALAFTIDDGVGNQLVLEVRSTDAVWELLALTDQ
jgi:hypothetical protein